MSDELDVAIIGAGAAGLATAIFAKRFQPALHVALFDGASRPGAKILVSGGGRCNVTNSVVTEADFNGGRPAVIRRVLGRFPAQETVAFFRELGVPLHEEPGGKLFPDAHRARDVLDALLRAVDRHGVETRFGSRVLQVSRDRSGFDLAMPHGHVHARAVVLASGGLSLPKTGSDGWGYGAAQRLGHSIVPTTPALVPLRLDPAGRGAIHASLSGVALPARLDIRVDGVVERRVTGALLWTHFGISGPVVLDASRHWLRARLEGRVAEISASFFLDEQFESLERVWIALARDRPRLKIDTALSDGLPVSVAGAVLDGLSIGRDQSLATLTRDDRRALVRALLEWPLPAQDSRGYNFAEVTAGGVAVPEIDAGSMASRVCPSLYLVGELIDVDGRLGGFNFQWAWATARVAGEALGRLARAAS